MSNETEDFEDDFVVASGSPDFRSELAAQLAELAPEVIADGKVDVAKLQELLGEDVADSAERFGLFWPGKKNALRVAQSPTTATLRPDIENSKDWDMTQNVFIEGDNLEVLKILQKHYHNKIKMIYIDPPYNTGKDFVYPDNFKEGLDSYLEWTRQVNEEGKKLSSNSETEGRYHSNWLNMMYPRLKLARNLLTDDGVIFVSIGEDENANLRLMLDGIFGSSNFVSQIVWHNNAKGRQMDPFIKNTYESVLVYARDISKVSLAGVVENVETESMEFDSISHFVKGYPLHNGTADFHIDNRPNLAYSIYYNPSTGLAKTVNEKEISSDNQKQMVIGPPSLEGNSLLDQGFVRILPKFNDRYKNQRVWRWGAEKFLREYETELIWQSEETGYYPYQKKRFIGGVNETKFKNYISIDGGRGRGELLSVFDAKIFDNPKPVDFIDQLIRICLTTDSLFLDFFAGSATSAHAVIKLNAEDGGNRKFIMVQLPEPTPEDSEARKAGYETIADISRERIRRAGAAIVAEREGQLDSGEKPLDVGFRSYKLNASNFAKWQVTSDVEAGKLGEHLMSLRGSADDDATPDDLLTEVLLKQGYSLSEQISKIEIAGLELHSVGDGLVLAYLNEHVKPSLEQFRAVVDSGPSRLIVLEDAYQGDDQLKTNLEQLCKSKSIELWRA